MTTLPQPLREPDTALETKLGAASIPATSSGVARTLLDYAELMKVRVTSLVMMSAWCGFYLAALKSGVSSISWALLHSLVGIGLVAGGTAALNQLVERDLDALMRRTNRRPLPAGRMGTRHAAIFGVTASIAGLGYLALTTNALTALLTLATSIAYLFAYTPLKRVSSWCTFVGAFPGAMPPVLGWTAMRGSLGWEPLALFAIVWVWQFPHFHSIAWLYREDYERARIRMLPVVEHDGRSTTRAIIGYSLLLIPVSVVPALLGMSSWIYAAGALILSAVFFWTGARLAALKASPAEPHSKMRARHVLQASVFYLPLLFGLLMLSATA